MAEPDVEGIDGAGSGIACQIALINRPNHGPNVTTRWFSN